MVCMCCVTCIIGVVLLYKVLDWLVRKPRIGRLGERYIFVTGADTGFGHEISKRLDELGCHVFAGCLTGKGEDDLRKQCSSRLKTVPLNVAKHDSVVQAYENVKALLPERRGLWGLFNNAGIAGAMGQVEWLHLSDYQKVLDVNLFGLVDVTTTILPLIKREKGRIINTSSVMGRHAGARSLPYCISKYGVESFSDSMRRQLRPFGVSVHLIEPGVHKTNITSRDNFDSSMRSTFANAPQAAKEEYGEDYLEQSIEMLTLGNKWYGMNFVKGMIPEGVFDVVDAYEHAALGLYPRARYVVGNDAKFVWLPIQWMPEWLGDFVLDKVTKDTPVPKALRK